MLQHDALWNKSGTDFREMQWLYSVPIVIVLVTRWIHMGRKTKYLKPCLNSLFYKINYSCLSIPMPLLSVLQKPTTRYSCQWSAFNTFKSVRNCALKKGISSFIANFSYHPLMYRYFDKQCRQNQASDKGHFSRRLLHFTLSSPFGSRWNSGMIIFQLTYST